MSRAREKFHENLAGLLLSPAGDDAGAQSPFQPVDLQPQRVERNAQMRGNFLAMI
jgi:hypothetical protein